MRRSWELVGYDYEVKGMRNAFTTIIRSSFAAADDKKPQLFSSPSAPHDQQVLFFNPTHTILSTFHSKNVRFFKFCREILRL